MSFSTFAQIRLVRLYPLILLGLSVGAIILSTRALLGHDLSFILRGSLAWLLALVMIPTPLLEYTVGEAAFPFNVPSWSLSAELISNAFYALFVRHLTDRVLAFVVAGSAILVLIFGVDGGPTFSTTHIGFVRVMFSFPAGIALYRLFRMGWLEYFKAPFLVIVALLLVTFCLPRGQLSWLVDDVSVLVTFPVIVAAGANIPMSGARKRISLFLGQLSYPLYILHHPLIKPFANVTRVYQLTGSLFVCWTVLEIVTIVSFSLAAMKFYDEPLRKILSRQLLRRDDQVVHAS